MKLHETIDFLVVFFCLLCVRIGGEQTTGAVTNSKVSVLSANRGKTALENELSHFTKETRGAFGSELVFNFKTGVKCTGVKYGGADVWTFAPGAGHPKTVTVNSALKTLWVSFAEFDFLTFKHDGSSWVFNKGLSVGAHSNYKTKEEHVANKTEAEETNSAAKDSKETKSEETFRGTESGKQTVSAEEPSELTQTIPPQPKLDTQTTSAGLEKTSDGPVSKWLQIQGINYADFYDKSNNRLGIRIKTRAEPNSEVVTVNDTTKYTVVQYSDVEFKYIFKEKVQCSEISYFNKLVWKDTFDITFYYPLSFTFYADSHTFLITMPGETSYRVISYKPIKIATRFEPFTYDDFRIRMKGGSKSLGQNGGDSGFKEHHYGYEFEIGGQTTVDEVYCNGAVVWKQNFLISQGKSPNSVYLYKENKKIGLKFEDFYITYKYLRKWVPLSTGKIVSFDKSDVKITTKQDGGSASGVNDESEYDLVNYQYQHEYIFKKSSKCVKVEYRSAKVWEHAPIFGEQYPKSISYNLNTNQFFVNFTDTCCFVYGYDDDVGWYMVSSQGAANFRDST